MAAVRTVARHLRRAYAETMAGRITTIGVILAAVIGRAITDLPFVAAISVATYALLMALTRTLKARKMSDPEATDN